MKHCMIIRDTIREFEDVKFFLNEVPNETVFCQEQYIITARIVGNLPKKFWEKIFLHVITPEGGNQHLVLEKSKIDRMEMLLQGMILPTAPGLYQYGLEIIENGAKKLSTEMEIIRISGPEGSTEQWDKSWTNGPVSIEVYPNLFLGNSMAAGQAHMLGLDAVLNVAEFVDVLLPKEVKYKKVCISDGAHISIEKDKIAECVTWIDSQLSLGKKILVNCRAGIGRSASIVIAYIYYKELDWSFGKAVEHVRKSKKNIYPHVGLQKTLEELYPSQKRPISLLHKIELCTSANIETSVGSQISIVVKLFYEGEDIPYVWLRSNLSKSRKGWKEDSMKQLEQNLWGIDIPCMDTGNYWATISASQYAPAVEVARVWLGYNILIESK